MGGHFPPPNTPRHLPPAPHWLPALPCGRGAGSSPLAPAASAAGTTLAGSALEEDPERRCGRLAPRGTPRLAPGTRPRGQRDGCVCGGAPRSWEALVSPWKPAQMNWGVSRVGGRWTGRCLGRGWGPGRGNPSEPLVIC